MAEFKIKVKNESNIKDKPRVYFTCHPRDFDAHFERICADLFKTQDCAVYYTEDMSEELTEENLSLDINRMNLIVVPVTLKLLVEDNRAMRVDIPFAMKSGIPVLPLMMEGGIVEIYSRPDRFGKRQFITPGPHTGGEISYEKKLSDFLSAILAPDDLVLRIRAEFDARIFLSYRKADRVWASVLLMFVHDNPKYRDIAIWYDEFLFPGESFDDNIKRSLWNCDVFALLVTPKLLELPNYVLEEEYPTAIKLGKPIIAVEMEKTDRSELEENYNGIPECVSGIDTDALYEALDNLLDGIVSTENNTSPEHNYLIGCAYLDGIDVEINRPLGLRLITTAAEDGYPEAVVALYLIYSSVGNYEQALKWAEVAYEKCATHLGEDSEVTEKILAHLASSCSNVGNYEKSYAIFKMIYNSNKHKYGEEHRNSLIALVNLVAALIENENYENALPLAEKSYNLNCKIFGEEHTSTLHSLNNLVTVCKNVGEIERAYGFAERLYALCVKYYGENHPETLCALSGLGVVCGNIGEREKAVKCCELAYKRHIEVLGERHPDTLISWANLANSYEVNEEGERVLAMLMQMYPVFCDVFGEFHPNTLERLFDLSMCLLLLGKKKEGIKYLKLCIKHYEAAYGPSNPSTGDVVNIMRAILEAEERGTT